MSTTQMCDQRQLEALLDGTLAEADEYDVTLHLEECQDCCEYIERSAATQQTWREASALLGHQPFDGALEEVSQRPPLIIQNVLDALAPTDDPAMIGRLGGMEVSGVVGAGAMGVVLKAFDKSLDRPVAIKVLAPHLASSGAARKRFSREAKAAAAVLHPNVMSIHSVSNDGPLPWLVMPYVRGKSLQSRINDEGPLPICEVLRIGSQIAAGLAAAHAQGLVHRDIKPANIMLEDGVERVAITDFGLARAVDDATMTRSGVIAGTPQYMSPEQARGEVIDQRSDLFSLGSVLYTMCAGRAPFRAETTFGVLRRITDGEPKPLAEINPEVPPWLAGIIGRLMSKNASERFESASELADLLEQCLAHVQQPAMVPLPQAVANLSSPRKQQSYTNSSPRSVSDGADYSLGRRVLAWFSGGAAIIVLGIILLLEWNKGTLVIECDATDVPIQVLKGNDIVEELTIVQKKTSIRIAAGEYILKIDGEFDGLILDDEAVRITRRGAEVVRIVQRHSSVSRPDSNVVPDGAAVSQSGAGASLELIDLVTAAGPPWVATTYILESDRGQMFERRSLADGVTTVPFDGAPAVKGAAFRTRLLLPAFSRRGADFVARNTVRMWASERELVRVSEGHRLVRAFYVPFGEETNGRQRLNSSTLNPGGSQVDWLKQVNLLGDLIAVLEINGRRTGKAATQTPLQRMQGNWYLNSEEQFGDTTASRDPNAEIGFGSGVYFQVKGDILTGFFQEPWETRDWKMKLDESDPEILHLSCLSDGKSLERSLRFQFRGDNYLNFCFNRERITRPPAEFKTAKGRRDIIWRMERDVRPSATEITEPVSSVSPTDDKDAPVASSHPLRGFWSVEKLDDVSPDQLVGVRAVIDEHVIHIRMSYLGGQEHPPYRYRLRGSGAIDLVEAGEGLSDELRLGRYDVQDDMLYLAIQNDPGKRTRPQDAVGKLSEQSVLHVALRKLQPGDVRQAVHGEIVRSLENFTEISIGADNGLKPGNKLQVFRQEKWVGELDVVSVKPDSASTRITREENAGLRRGDEVVRVSEFGGFGEPDYSKLKRFSFPLGKIEIDDECFAGEELLIRYPARMGTPNLFAAWGVLDKNSIVVIAPLEAEQSIRKTLAQWERLALEVEFPKGDSVDRKVADSKSSAESQRSGLPAASADLMADQPDMVVRSARADPGFAGENSLTGYWSVQKLGDVPLKLLAGARAVIDEQSIYIRVPQFDGKEHPHYRYTLKGNDGIDLVDAENDADDEVYLGKYQLRNDTLYLAIRTEYHMKTRPVDVTGTVPQDEVEYIVLKRPQSGATKQSTVRGMIIGNDKGLVQISIGADDGLKSGSALQVFRDDRSIGEIKVVQVSPDSSAAKVEKQFGESVPSRGDEVVGIVSHVSVSHPSPPDHAVVGTITSADGERYKLSIGFDDGLRPGAKLKVFRDEECIGQLEVANTQDPDSAEARVEKKKKGVQFKVGDEVVGIIVDATSATPDESIYNEDLRRFRIPLKRIQVQDSIESGHAFLRRYQTQKNAPRLYAAWGDAATNSVVVIGPVNAGPFIRTTIDQWKDLKAARKNSVDMDSTAIAHGQSHAPQSVRPSDGAALTPQPEAIVGSVRPAAEVSQTDPVAGSMQVLLRGPKKSATISLTDSNVTALPQRLNLTATRPRSFIVSRAVNSSVEYRVYATLEVEEVNPQTKAYVQHNAVPIQVTEDDIDRALIGEIVTKVVYLPNAENTSAAIAGVESLVTTRLDPGTDPVVEAQKLGSILAVLRLENRKPDSAEVSSAATDPRTIGKTVSDELWELLGEWQLASESVGGKHGRLSMRVYDHTFETEEMSSGEFWYQRPDRFRFDRQPVSVTPEIVESRQKKNARVQRNSQGEPYKLVSGGQDQDMSVICIDSQITLIDRGEKSATVIKTGRHLLSGHLAKLAIPMIGEVRRTDLIDRFEISIEGKPQPKDLPVTLKLVPKHRDDRKHWSELGVVLDRKTLQPKAIRWTNPAGTRETRIVVTEVELNSSQQVDKLADEVWNPDLTEFDVHIDDQTVVPNDAP